MECGEIILNFMICPDCLARELTEWLKGKRGEIGRKNTEQLQNKVKFLLKINKKVIGNSDKCIVCGKRTIFLCPYCFTKYVYEELKELNVSDDILREFFHIFNFDFEHTGYSQEMEKLGML